jgi:UDP-N-acetylmuramate dehydrogenase
MNALAGTPDSGGKLLHDEPLSRHTSWRVGGPADVYFQPAELAELERFLAELDPLSPVTFIGLGSNLLVRDGGIRGAVVNVAAMATAVEQLDERRLKVDAGVPCTVVARTCVRLGLGPAAFFAGIPGSLGGALAMNAGAFGGETWQRVEQVTTIDRRGELHRREPTEFSVGYREVGRRKDEWFIDATLRFESQPDSTMADIQALVAKRKATQPIGQLSCGSVFRNPAGDFAARLIEVSGLKGLRHGAAEVSEKHANFIINTGSATASDIEALIAEVCAQVQAQQGVELQLEVRIVGDTLGDQKIGTQ